MSNFGYKEELHKYEDVDEDELLATLTSEELQELEREMAEIDPDENTPIGMRQWDQTAKQPTGPFCREALLKHWQRETLKLRETEGSHFALQQESMDESQTDKSEEECLSESDTEPSQGTLHLPNNKKNLARNSRQENSNQIFISSSQPDGKDTDSNGHCRGKLSGARKDIHYQLSSNLNLMPEGPSRNPTDTDGILEKILRNDQSVTEVNLNNIENLSQEMLISFAEALTSNMHVRVLSLANTHADDQVAFALANMLKKNYGITSLNIESNFISGRGILALIRSLQQNTSLVELRFQNQRHICGGQVEMEMVKLLRENTTLLKLGYQFDLPGPRMSATSILTRNQDHKRQTRLQLQRQHKMSEAMVDQTTHIKRNGPISKPQSMPHKTPDQFPQVPKHSSLLNPKPQLLNAERNYEKNAPTRNLAEMGKLQEITADTQGLNKHNAEKVHSQAKEKESGDVLREMKHALKQPPRRKQEARNGQQSVHGDLMAAIRSNRRTLNRVSATSQQNS
ncbi:leiomodin-2a [Salminus brasiliensis]|uniref:leiomodin-2a n=1 Tax=Salminus brasiliensis TaxID=930266 RepID=UPI003B831F83